MDKHVCFYCINNDNPHSADKICLGWDYEPEEDTKYLAIMKELGICNHKIDYNAVYKALDDGKVCDRCAWFFRSRAGIESPMVLGKHSIDHSHFDPVYRSDWFIDNFVRCGAIAREYDKNDGQRYRYTLQDIQEMRSDVLDMGKPIRDSDKAACAETLVALDWAADMFHKHGDGNIDLLYFGVY